MKFILVTCAGILVLITVAGFYYLDDGNAAPEHEQAQIIKRVVEYCHPYAGTVRPDGEVQCFVGVYSTKSMDIGDMP